MKPDHSGSGQTAPTGHTTRFLRITPGMARARAGELAEIKGRQACDVTASDLIQARHDLARKPGAKK